MLGTVTAPNMDSSIRAWRALELERRRVVRPAQTKLISLDEDKRFKGLLSTPSPSP